MYRELRILLLEDTEAHQALITHMLSKIGATQVSLAKTPGDFLEILERRGSEFNAFLIDVQLGDGQMNGIQALKEARKRGIQYPAAIITMDTQGIDFADCYEIGVTEIVDKSRLYDDGVMQLIARGLYDRHLGGIFLTGAAMLVPAVLDDITYLPASDVLFMQLDDEGYSIHTFRGVYKTSLTLRMYGRLLEPFGFLSVSKHHLINMNRVESFNAFDQAVSFYCDPLKRQVPVAEAKIPAVRKVIRARNK
jgi:DNA-binding LytR/AlgR family response regulator